MICPDFNAPSRRDGTAASSGRTVSTNASPSGQAHQGRVHALANLFRLETRSHLGHTLICGLALYALRAGGSSRIPYLAAPITRLTLVSRMQGVYVVVKEQ